MDRGRILASSAVGLARAVRERRLAVADLVEAHIERIRRVNPVINAVVAHRFEDARREAREADERVASSHPDDLPPLFGVPFTAKDALACAGMPHTSGLRSRRNVVAERDATAVRRLKEAGAIPVGVTNISELCMWMESSNRVWGRTSNPYDPGRTAGGSSGGEGAIVGAGGVPIGLGSDVGGSIRMPAFFNGVFGHKPTGGLVPNTGHYPPAAGMLERYVTTGPLARRAEDLMPFLRVVAGPDGLEARSISAELGDPAAVDLRKVTVFVVRDNALFAVDRRMTAAQEEAARALEARGARVERRVIPALKRSIEIWSAMLHESGSGKTFYELMADGGELSIPRELLKLPLGRSDYTLPALLLCWVERLPSLMAERTRSSVRMGEELKQELDRMLGEDGVILFPSYPSVAPRHGAPLLVPFKWVYTGIFNVLEMPVTQVPLGLDERGVPLGVQIAGANRRDALTIRLAIELEAALGGWVPPPRWPL